ncbi:MAG: hypothetical protein HFG05_10615 [Oscillibacter sp.]|nr:hypothetical protein [Oscillibacter sp.]
MKMDLKLLCKGLSQAKEEEAVSAQDCNSYLLDRVLRPLMRDETLLLKNIDFSQFDAEDIHTLQGYYESLEMQGQRLMGLVGTVAAIEPAARKVRQFC